MSSICHVEYTSSDFANTQNFYEQIFGWSFRTIGDHMMVFGDGDGHIGGFVKSDTPCSSDTPAIYYKVEDLDGMVVRALALGATQSRQRHEVPGVGFSASIADADGNRIGMVEFTS